jgi:hypothetical protein
MCLLPNLALVPTIAQGAFGGAPHISTIGKHLKPCYMPGACSLSPHIPQNELDLDFDLVKVDHKTHKTEDGRDFYELSPFGYVPLLELDDGHSAARRPRHRAVLG